MPHNSDYRANPVVSGNRSTPENQREDTIITPDVVAGLKAGDYDAFEKIYVSYARPLTRFILKLTGSPETAEEVTQETFIALWEQRETLDPSRKLKSYLFVIARRAAFRRIFRKNIFDDYPEVGDLALLSDNLQPEDIIEAKETMLLIDIAVENMPALRRSVFMLFRDGKTAQEIADQLGISKDNVITHISRARKDIRELVALIIFFAVSSIN